MIITHTFLDKIIYFFGFYAIYILPILILAFYIYKKSNLNLKDFYIKDSNTFKKLILKIKNSFYQMLFVGISACAAWAFGSVFLKNVFKLSRPETVGQIITPNDLYSFPSGHTTFMFALATGVYTYDKKLGLFTFIIGLLIGLSRVWTGVHFYRDIAGGIVVGMICGYVFTKILKRYFKI